MVGWCTMPAIPNSLALLAQLIGVGRANRAFVFLVLL